MCDACGLPFSDEEWDNRHTPHEPGCPFSEECGDPDMEEYSDLESAFDDLMACDCDLNYHESCCPACNAVQKGENT